MFKIVFLGCAVGSFMVLLQVTKMEQDHVEFFSRESLKRTVDSSLSACHSFGDVSPQDRHLH